MATERAFATSRSTSTGRPSRTAPRGSSREYPGLSVHAVVGDFERDLGHVPAAEGRRLVVFFGSTIGNLDPPERHRFLSSVRGLLHDRGDRFVLGVDLVKDTKGAGGGVRRRQRGHAGVQPQHPPGGEPRSRRGLPAGGIPAPGVLQCRRGPHRDAPGGDVAAGGAPPALGLDLHFAAGDDIWTESSYKFTRSGVEEMLEKADLELTEWHEDEAGYFALAVARSRI